MFRLPFRGSAPPARSGPGDPTVTRALRDEYAPPADPAYWNGLEARVLAAVRQSAGRVAGRAAAPLEWWQALAGWGRPGLVAAAAVLFLTGVVTARATRATDAAPGASFRELLGLPAVAVPADPDIALPDPGIAGEPTSNPEAQAARDAAYLLSDGLERRRAVRLDSLTGDARPGPGETRRAEREKHEAREATFRYVLPEE